MKALQTAKGYWAVISAAEEDDNKDLLAHCGITLRVTGVEFPALTRGRAQPGGGAPGREDCIPER